MILGAIVILVVGSLTIKYLKNDSGRIPEELLNNNSIESVSKKHTVAKGENLWILAENYYGDGFKWTEIATENKLENASIIEEGQELIIPNLETAEITEGENSITSATYEVVEGDSLWNIAVRAYGDGYKWAEIAKENNIVNPNVIHTGNVLILPR